MPEYGDDSMKECLYIKYEEDDYGVPHPRYYAYGAPWVAQALLMDDIKFDTPEEARAWWVAQALLMADIKFDTP